MAKAVDDFDGDDVGGANRFLTGRHMAFDDGVEFEQVPEPTSQKDIAEAAGIGPGDVAHMHAHDVGVVGERDRVIGEEAELLGIALAVVEDDRALPAAFLIGVEFAQVGNDVLAWPRLGADALDQGEVGVRRAGLGPRVYRRRNMPPFPEIAENQPGDRLRTKFPLHRVSDANLQNPSRIRTGKVENQRFWPGSAQDGLAVPVEIALPLRCRPDRRPG